MMLVIINNTTMRLIAQFTTLASIILLSACMHKGPNPNDPYESVNRKINQFNLAFDATVLKPPARLYVAVVPAPVRGSINNAFNNINMIPTVANDVLQGEWRYTIKDTWRFLINSTFGVAGLFDVADKRCQLPPHSNDLGLTFAKWGYKQSAYMVIPFIGPSTVRDSIGMLFEYQFMTPYPLLEGTPVIYSVFGLRYVDLRSQYFDAERLMKEALDPYSFMRDAYLQHRNFRITGEQASSNTNSDYVDENGSNEGSDYVDADNELGSDYVDDEPALSKKSD